MSKELENILIAKQITPTPMRVMVLEYVLKQSTAISLSDLEKEFQHSDKTTLYRTVKTFEEKGLIHDIKDGTEAARYALCEADCTTGVHHDLHLHFYCTGSKKNRSKYYHQWRYRASIGFHSKGLYHGIAGKRK